jgi:hypothetical protein
MVTVGCGGSLGFASRGGTRQAVGMSTSDLAELSSLRAQLVELTARVVSIAERADSSPDNAVAVDLFTAERSLLVAGRAIDRAISHLTP